MLMFLLGCIEANVSDDATESVVFAEAGELALSLSPEVLDFGVVPIGAQAVEVITVRNEGDGEIFLTDLRASSDAFELAASDNMLLPGASQLVHVYWQPLESGEMSEELTLVAGAGLSEQTEVPVGLAGLAYWVDRQGPPPALMGVSALVLGSMGIGGFGQVPGLLHREETVYASIAVTERPWEEDGRLVRELWQNGGSSSAEYVDTGEPAHTYAKASGFLLAESGIELQSALILGGAALTPPGPFVAPVGEPLARFDGCSRRKASPAGRF